MVYDKDFLRYAFAWGNTAQGADVWLDRDREYQIWYNSGNRPFSWEKYCEQNPVTCDDWYITGTCKTLKCGAPRERNTDWDVATMSKELCNAFIAYMKLIQLRNAWIEGFVVNDRNRKYCKITYCMDKGFFLFWGEKIGLSFPSPSMAQEFIETFKDLLETAKPLL